MTPKNLIPNLKTALVPSIDATPFPAALIDLNHQVIYVNQAFSDATGKTLAQMLGERVSSLVSLYPSLTEILDQKGTGDFEIFAQGSSTPLLRGSVAMAPMVDQGNELCAHLLVLHERGEQSETEKAATQTARDMQDVINAISQGFALYNERDELIMCNEALRNKIPEMSDILKEGCTYEEFIRLSAEKGIYDLGGRTKEEWVEMHVKRRENLVTERYEQMMSNGRCFQVSRQRTDSNRRVSIWTDVTSLKTAEKKSQRAYEDLEVLTNSLTSAIVEIDQNGIVLFINNEACSWFASDRSELIGIRMRDQMTADIRDIMAPARARAYEGEISKVEFCYKFLDGVTRDVELQYIPRFSPDGEVTSLILVAADITDHLQTDRTLANLVRISSNQSLTSAEKIQGILKIGCEHFGLPCAIVGEVDGEDYEVIALERPNVQLNVCKRFALANTLSEETLRSDDPTAYRSLTVEDLKNHPYETAQIIKTYIGAPLKIDGKPFGTISFIGDQPRTRRYTKADHEIIRQFADWVGNEIAHERDHAALIAAKQRLEHLANTDDLTGLMNRRAFIEGVTIEIARYRRTKLPFTLLMLDLDHFKSVNDNYGHGAGDVVLKLFAENAGKDLRSIDLFGRLGGEEFCIVLENTCIEEGMAAAERIRSAVEKACAIPQTSKQVTCSIGLTQVTETDLQFSTLASRADAALYKAKQEGRNRCMAYDPDFLKRSSKSVFITERSKQSAS